jgi:hypothetical protein
MMSHNCCHCCYCCRHCLQTYLSSDCYWRGIGEQALSFIPDSLRKLFISYVADHLPQYERDWRNVVVDFYREQVKNV